MASMMECRVGTQEWILLSLISDEVPSGKTGVDPLVNLGTIRETDMDAFENQNNVQVFNVAPPQSPQPINVDNQKPTNDHSAKQHNF